MNFQHEYSSPSTAKISTEIRENLKWQNGQTKEQNINFETDVKTK
jgi:hypothetical protein